jgi:dextranase
MQLTDFHPAQGTFLPGQRVSLVAAVDSPFSETVGFRLLIRRLGEEVELIEGSQDLLAGSQTLHFEWTPPLEPAGYSAALELDSRQAEMISSASTSFDILERWTDFPRYGFLSDFGPGRSDPDAVMNSLLRFHINGLQFYDWQYRHDQLLAPTQEYIDPLGRPLSLKTIHALVDSAHRHGIAALPYLAVYAASAAFGAEHRDWSLYDESGKPMLFGENFLSLMDPSSGKPWSTHLLGECRRALEAAPFDGLHIDQYGEPKRAWNMESQPVDLPEAFVDFIQAAGEQHPGKAVVFNCVGNWPIDRVALSPVAFPYIEVWPPEVQYRQLARIVLEAVRLSGGKPVVIALYLPAERPGNILLADALILACGGTRIELGEQSRLLADPYFPRHQPISEGLLNKLRSTYDYAVRNGEWLMPYALTGSRREEWAQGVSEPGFIELPASIWAVARRVAQGITVQFVNFSGLDENLRWDEEHPAPAACREIPVRVQLKARPERVSWDSPEESCAARSLPFTYENGELRLTIPSLHYTGLIHIHG